MAGLALTPVFRDKFPGIDIFLVCFRYFWENILVSSFYLLG